MNFSRFLPVRFRFAVLLLVALGLAAPGSLRAQTEDAATRELKALVERQRTLLARAAAAEDAIAIEDVRAPLQRLVFDYEAYVKKYPDVAAGYASYAMLLGNPLIEERRRAVALLLRANQVDSDLPLVKNQLGKYLAEEGRPLEAINYFLAANKLEPAEPLYHFQIALLLSAARDDFLKSGAWTREAIDRAMLDGFRQAANLAPDSIPYAYRYCEAYYDLETPDWPAALVAWRALGARLTAPIERQTVALHEANVLLRLGRGAEAEAVLATVTDERLATQKEKLVAQPGRAGDK